MSKEQAPRLSHSFDFHIALALGVTEAIVFQHIHYWVHQNSIEGRNFHDETWWTYNSSEKMTEYMPYLSAKQIKLALQNLCASGYLIKGNYNKNAFDRTAWYTVNGFKKELTIGPNGPMGGPNRARPQAESGPSNNTSKNPIEKTQVRVGATPTPPPTLSSFSQSSSSSTRPSPKKQNPIGTHAKSPVPLPAAVASPQPRADAKMSVRPNVRMTQGELDGLEGLYPPEQLEWMLNKLEAHKASTGKQYKSDYATMNPGGWVHSAFQEHQSKPAAKKPPSSPTPPECDPDEDPVQQNKWLAEAYKKRYTSADWILTAGNSQVEFVGKGNNRGKEGPTLAYTEKGFQSQLDGLLYKMDFSKR